jgi:hypothetical protein
VYSKTPAAVFSRDLPKELVMLENCGHLPIEEPGFSRLEEVVVAFLKKLHLPLETMANTHEHAHQRRLD